MNSLLFKWDFDQKLFGTTEASFNIWKQSECRLLIHTTSYAISYDAGNIIISYQEAKVERVTYWFYLPNCFPSEEHTVMKLIKYINNTAVNNSTNKHTKEGDKEEDWSMLSQPSFSSSFSRVIYFLLPTRQYEEHKTICTTFVNHIVDNNMNYLNHYL